MNKRAELKIPLETVVGIIIAVIIILGLFVPLFMGIYNFFFGSKVSELSINNFIHLSSEVGDVLDAEGSVNSSIVVSFDDSIKIVAFNYDCNTNQDPDCPQKEKDVYLVKPKMCSISEACLCYFDAKKQNTYDDALSCISYGKNTVFVVDVNSKISSAYAGEFSTVQDFIFSPTESGLGTKKISIEKTESNGVTTLFLFVEGKRVAYAQA